VGADGAPPRPNRKLALRIADLPIAKLQRLASARMDGEYAGLDALMDD